MNNPPTTKAPTKAPTKVPTSFKRGFDHRNNASPSSREWRVEGDRRAKGDRRAIFFYDDGEHNAKWSLNYHMRSDIFSTENIESVRFFKIPGADEDDNRSAPPTDPTGTKRGSAVAVSQAEKSFNDNGPRTMLNPNGWVPDRFYCDSGLSSHKWSLLQQGTPPTDGGVGSLDGPYVQHLNAAIERDEVAAIVLDFDRVVTLMEGLFVRVTPESAASALDEWVHTLNDDVLKDLGPWTKQQLVAYYTQDPQDANAEDRQNKLRVVFQKAHDRGIPLYILTNNGYIVPGKYHPEITQKYRAMFREIFQIAFGVDIPEERLLAGGSATTPKPYIIMTHILSEVTHRLDKTPPLAEAYAAERSRARGRGQSRRRVRIQEPHFPIKTRRNSLPYTSTGLEGRMGLLYGEDRG